MLGETSELREKEMPVWAWEDPITVKWRGFHLKHPEVYSILVNLTKQAYVAGRQRIGIGMLFEVMRWEMTIADLPDDHEGYKMPNEYRSRYARLLMDWNPEWEGIFSVKTCEGAWYR